MIKFFRKIRQQLAYENNISKYFRYAIGEIVLVVIGILIALSINNWNETRKLRIAEKEILNVLKLSTSINLSELEKNHKRVTRFIVNTDSILSLLDQKKEIIGDSRRLFSTALQSGFRVEGRLSMTGYSALQNSRAEILESKELRNTIIDLYGTHLPWLEKNGKEWSSYLQDIGLDLINSGTIIYTIDSGYQPRDIYNPEKFEVLRSVISLRRSQKSRGLRSLQDGIDKCHNILDLIDKELNK